MKKTKKILVLTCALTMLATPFTSFAATMLNDNSTIVTDFGGDPVTDSTLPIYGDDENDVSTFALEAKTTANVNFRSKPSTVDGEIYYLIRKGSTVTLIDTTSYGNFVKVKHQGKIGYIHKDYLSL